MFNMLSRSILLASLTAIQFNFYFDFVNIYMIEIHHWLANNTELIEAGSGYS